MTLLYLVRHGQATGGWDSDPDPGLDDLGREQATTVSGWLAPLGPMTIVTSPMVRCRQTAAHLASIWGTRPQIDRAVSEIPSPEGFAVNDRVTWLRGAMTGKWADLGARYLSYRAGVLAALAANTSDTVVFSHFIAINVAVGACLSRDELVIRSLDNCSVTIVEHDPTRPGRFELVEGGHEADTLIR